ncbi:ATP-dependent DNA helicase [Picrophilus oshimae]|uniref:ATP-dependent DNA helicase Hel308 n=1 Tax=Picrophilus torridus (strain ATCC 700027 / DSM 9790 / JCM 10055 / NBRC 100828 / KAW 2/3) TaxID=1122961 RepID=A0A8G2FWY5_PICTO|nr:ATP-dependent DNA helicase [Picrophilus oshimae]SMD30963.1 helicase [Picrophilus oshimae DSM 9789]
MKVSDVFPDEFLNITGSDFELYKHQIDAIERLKNNENVIVSVPTASGKSLIGYYAIYKAFLAGKKSMYIVPLRSLAMEKYEELLNLRSLNMRITISIGDYDSPPSFIKNNDVIVVTSERADSMIHHDPDIINDFGAIIADEIHIINDEDRGPRLETVLSSIRVINPDALILGLSATISNVNELAQWLNASTVVSNFRAVPLELGIIYKKRLITDSYERYLGQPDELSLIKDIINDGGQALVFRNSRKNAEKYAEMLIQHLPEFNDFNNDGMPESLVKMIRHGIAYHHAGLSNEDRRNIEEMFKNGYIKVISATPTLAAGVNLPARLVIIRDITRYSNGYSRPISNIEIQQMLGRAGRPKYDKMGYGYIYAASPASYDAAKKALSGEPEPVISKMDSQRLMRFNILALISSGMASRMEDLILFYNETLMAIQKDVDDYYIESALYFLKENGFIDGDVTYNATRLGRLTSDLYIDPETALILKSALDHDYDEKLYLYYICRTPDMINIPAGTREYEYIEDFLEDINVFDFSEESLSAAKTAMVLLGWINEMPMQKITDTYNIGPGDVQQKASSADWISYSLYRLSSVYKKEMESKLFHLNIRIKEGIKPDLIDLIKIPKVGRVRARRLYDNGFKTVDDIARSSPENIEKIFGFSKNLAAEIVNSAMKISSMYYRSQ